MHRTMMPCCMAIVGAIVLAGGAQAQVADRLSRGITPNAIDRSLSQSPAPRSADIGAAAERDRQRAEQAAREAADRRGLPASSTLADGPGGVQRLGTGAATPAAPAALPTPPQP